MIMFGIGSYTHINTCTCSSSCLEKLWAEKLWALLLKNSYISIKDAFGSHKFSENIHSNFKPNKFSNYFKCYISTDVKCAENSLLKLFHNSQQKI